MGEPLRPYVPSTGYQVAPPPRPVGRPPKTNEFAIAALVAGLGGGNVLGIGLALIAFRQIRERGQSGRWMAVVGLVSSVFWLVVLFAVVVVPVFL